jgi:hypothetical protein
MATLVVDLDCQSEAITKGLHLTSPQPQANDRA